MGACAVRTAATASSSKNEAATSRKSTSSSVPTARHETVLTLEYDTSRQASTVERSLRPEVGDIEGERTRATLEREGRTVRIDIEATDLVALRAGQNTWLSLVSVAERVTVDES